jgi:hypothetical protein
MGLFGTNWKIQVEIIQAPVYRVGALLDFLRALGGQLQSSNDAVGAFDATVRKQAKWNGQKIVLQGALNDYFGLAANTIYITTNSVHPSIYCYNEAESVFIYCYNELEATKLYCWNEAEVSSPYSFTVAIPIGIYTAELARRVTSIVNLFKLAGTTFNVISV